MPNSFSLAGAQPQKQTRFAPIYTGRWSSGIWTNRSPLRDANTTRLTEKFYGAAGDALIAGQNVEITTRLTLARRPGNSIFDTNVYTGVDRFYEFRQFSPTTEQIDVMVDQRMLFILFTRDKSPTSLRRVPGPGRATCSRLGTVCIGANGVDNKKWLQSLVVWSLGASWNTPTTPFFLTFFIDPAGNIQQLTSTILNVTDVAVTNNVVTVTTAQNIKKVLSPGLQVQFPSGMAASFLSTQTVTIVSVLDNSFTAAFSNADYPATPENNVVVNEVTGGASPTSGATNPAWSTVVPSSANHFQGGFTNDGTAQWTNRGNPVENWGIGNGVAAPAPQIGSSRSAWSANTYYSIAGAVLDTNGNLQQVTFPGKSGTVVPTWNTSLTGTTVDGSVTWTMIQNAASLVWQPHTAYKPGSYLIGNASGRLVCSSLPHSHSLSSKEM